MVVCVSPDLLARERIFSANVSGGVFGFLTVLGADF